jgi:hypothetical protein
MQTRTVRRRQPRTLAALKTDPRISEVYRDSDGIWVYFVYGWRNTYDEPMGCLHGIHEDTVKAVLARVPSIAACDCPDCLSGGVK